MSQDGAGYPDFQDHLAALEARGLLRRIDRPIDKDTELHPLVRWQFQGGLGESERSAFLFTRVTGTDGRLFEIPVAVGALAATPQIYAVGMGVEVEEIGARWLHAMKNPVAPVSVDSPPCQQVVVKGEALTRPGGGLDALPVPISTPGYDAAPYLVATLVVTRDPDTGVRNMGTYRAALKAPDRLGVRMATRVGGAGGYLHWQKYRARGEPMPCAIAVGAPPAVAYSGPQKLPVGQDEMAVAGGIVGAPIRVSRAVSVDLEVPADAEIVVEGLIDTERLEPEGPFGESHGHVALEDFNMSMQVTAITRKRSPVFASIVSQVTPSESSVLKKVAYEPLFLAHLRDELKVQGILSVNMHEPLTNLRPVIFLRFTTGTPREEVWRGIEGASTLQAPVRQDRHRPERGHRCAEHRRHLLVAGVPHESRGRSPDRLRPQPRPWPQGSLRGGRVRHPGRRHPQGADDSVGASRPAVHGKRPGDLGGAGTAGIVAATSVARLCHGRMDRRLGGLCKKRGRRTVAENGAQTWLRRRSGVDPETPVSEVR